MDQNISVVIRDKDGWRKVFPLQKRLIHIGSDIQNDVVLENWRGAGVAPRHLQLIAGDSDEEYRLVNLGDTDIRLGATGDRVLEPRSAANISTGEHIRVGDFSVLLNCDLLGGIADEVPASDAGDRTRHPGPASSAQASSRVIGLELFLPKIELDPDHPIEGSVIVRNLGTQPAVQFKLAVEGLHPDCYDIGAGPLLFPNAEKEVYLRLFHPRGPNLLAGEHRFSVRAKAPEAYPEESVKVSKAIRVLPFHNHTVRLVTPN